MSLLSHPNRKLEDHLFSVADLMLERVRNLNFCPSDAFGISSGELEKLSKAIGVLHDIGKASSGFQEAIRKGQKPPPHSPLSALASVPILLYSRYFCNRLIGMTAYIIYLHHSPLKRPEKLQFVAEWDTDDSYFSDVLRFGKDIFEKAFGTKVEERALKVRKEDTLCASIEDFIKNVLLEWARKDGLRVFFLAKFLHSLLADADAFDAAFSGENAGEFLPRNVHYLRDNLLAYARNLGNRSAIDAERKQLLKEALRNAEGCTEDDILLLRAPTGSGKTLTGVISALTASRGKGPLVYCLPFINIVEQTADAISEAIGSDADILPFHHLSVRFESIAEERGLSVDKAMVLYNGWHFPIVVTTFASLFSALISPRKCPFFHRILGSTLVLDEVQSIRPSLWHLLREIMHFLSRHCRTTVVVSTATLPEVFRSASSRFLLSVKKLKSIGSRYEIRVENISSIEGFGEAVRRLCESHRRVLAILNTVREAEEVFDLLKGRLPKDLIFLSSKVIPKHRRERIQEAKNRKNVVVVSTQVIEAGVDISFEAVIRDFAPLDSIVQAAGRCNRSYEICFPAPLVIANKVVDPRTGKEFASYIYNQAAIRRTEEILKGGGIREEEVLEMLERYYKAFENDVSMQESREALKSARELKFDELDKVSPIEKKSYGIEVLVFVEADDTAKSLREEYEKEIVSRSSEGKFAKLASIRRIVREMMNYTVAVTISRDLAENLTLPRVGRFFVVEQGRLGEFYDPDKGFKVGEGPVFL